MILPPGLILAWSRGLGEHYIWQEDLIANACHSQRIVQRHWVVCKWNQETCVVVNQSWMKNCDVVLKNLGSL